MFDIIFLVKIHLPIKNVSHHKNNIQMYAKNESNTVITSILIYANAFNLSKNIFFVYLLW